VDFLRGKAAVSGANENAAAHHRRGVFWSQKSNPRLLDDLNGFLDVVVSPVNVIQGALLEALRKCIVFLPRDVIMGLADKLERLVQASAPVEVDVDGGMVVDVFAIVDRSALDFSNGFVDLMNGLFFLIVQFAATRALQVGARVTKIGKRVQIGRMIRCGRGFGGAVGGHKDQQGEDCENQFRRVYELHRFLSSVFDDRNVTAPDVRSSQWPDAGAVSAGPSVDTGCEEWTWHKVQVFPNGNQQEGIGAEPPTLRSAAQRVWRSDG